MTLPAANAQSPLSVALADNQFGTTTTSVTPTGELKVANPPTQLFNDTFDTGTLDTTNRWTTPTAGGTGIIASNAVGQTVLNGGTTANSFSKLTSQVSFSPTEPGYLYFTARINIESPLLTTGHRFWGFGTSPGSPTIASPITQGVGFEIGTNGKLFAVTYQTGTRVPIADLSSTGNNSQPTNSSAHKYFIYFKGDQCYWAIDTVENVVANYQTGALGPDINTLPVLFQVISNAGAAETLTLNGTTVGDTAQSTSTQADGVFGWRRQTIYPQGASFSAQVNTEGQRATYRYAVLGFTPVATPTAFAVIQGSATKVVRIKRIYVSGVATAAGNMPLVITRRSTAGTLGSAVLSAISAAKHDTNDGAATAVVSTVGTANYTTLGTANGQLCVDRIGLSAVGTGVADTPALYEFATRNDKPIILRGTSDFLTLEGNGAAVPAGGALDIEIETEEDTF